VDALDAEELRRRRQGVVLGDTASGRLRRKGGSAVRIVSSSQADLGAHCERSREWNVVSGLPT
jgi:hypothetical protein